MRQTRELEKAIECFNTAISKGKHFFTLDPTILRCYLCRGEYYESLIVDVSKSVLNENKNHKRAIWNKKTNLAQIYAEASIREYSRAIHIFPTKYLLFLHRGSLLLKQGRMLEATSDFHAAFDLNTSIAETFIQRALILSFQRRYQQIVQEFEEKKRSRKMNDPALLILVAKARIRCEDYSGALLELSSVIELGVKNDPHVYLQRGICYEHLEEWEAARAEFSQCLTLIPSYSKAYYHRGLCTLYTGNIEGGIIVDNIFSFGSRYCHSI
jgi:tetratricopeptide (TPR) repeat protein